MRKTHALWTLWIALAVLFSAGCQTAAVKKFGDVKPGMEKNDVLELLGNPTRTERQEGNEKWVYRFYENDKETLKQVVFDGAAKVVSSGENVEESKRIEEIKASDQKRAAKSKKSELIHLKAKAPADAPVRETTEAPVITNPNETFRPVPGTGPDSQ